MSERTMTGRILDLDEIVRILNSRYGITAYVEQTGGGTATIYAGEPFVDPADPMGPTWGNRWPCLAGPGWFDGPNWTQPHADTADFAIGPDDDGQNDPTYAGIDWDEDRVAREIATEINGSVVVFQDALKDFIAAGLRLTDAWDAEDFHADEMFPLPDRLRPPLSLDEWLIELDEHYRGFAQQDMREGSR